jgi:3-deoxy-D-manno-octulosonate 8-phosphate phosphatase (KDO 8-P phosphatase)
MTDHHPKPQWQDKAANVKAFLLDVDGVLTDGGLYVGETAEAFKRFNTLDGHGLKLLQQAGIQPVIITGRDSAALRQRVSELGIALAYFGVENKRQAAQTCLQQLNLDWTQVAAMGDDWPDLPMLMPAAVSFAPPQAHPEVLKRVHHVCTAGAGHGAVRQACDLLLQASNHYQRLLNSYLT